MNDKLEIYSNMIGDKIDKVNESYDKARLSIELDCKRCEDEINESTNALIKMLNEKKAMMLKDVELTKSEMLMAFKHRYGENNDKVNYFRDYINYNYIANQSKT